MYIVQMSSVIEKKNQIVFCLTSRIFGTEFSTKVYLYLESNLLVSTSNKC